MTRRAINSPNRYYLVGNGGQHEFPLTPDNTLLPVTDADAFNLAEWELHQFRRREPDDVDAVEWKVVHYTWGGRHHPKRTVCVKPAHGAWSAA